MNDQKTKLESLGIKVCRLRSKYERESCELEEFENSLNNCSVILASPEAVLNKYRTVLRRKEIRESIKCLAIDEGHCIVKWGSSSRQAKAFRSDYFNIAELRSILSGEDRVPVVVLTATATPDVEKEIIENLQMNNVTRLISPPDRPNIRYSVVRVKNDAEDQYFSWLIEELLNQRYCARRVIIFCKSHAHCRSLYKLFHVSLKSCSFSSYKDRPFAMFHAGTDNEIKSFILESFSKENGTVRVLFATTAFGMGVDCKGLNLVVHYGPPNDVDDYVQESGRAGRDNSKSHAVLLSYPRCTSGKVSKAMKDYVKNTELFGRKMLLQ